MADVVSEEVIRYLLRNPKELARIEASMQAEEDAANRKRLKEMQPPVPVKMVPCGTYGCTEPKPEGSVFCKSCYLDYLEDPDAYK